MNNFVLGILSGMYISAEVQVPGGSARGPALYLPTGPGLTSVYIECVLCGK